MQHSVLKAVNDFAPLSLMSSSCEDLKEQSNKKPWFFKDSHAKDSASRVLFADQQFTKSFNKKQDFLRSSNRVHRKHQTPVIIYSGFFVSLPRSFLQFVWCQWAKWVSDAVWRIAGFPLVNIYNLFLAVSERKPKE